MRAVNMAPPCSRPTWEGRKQPHVNAISESRARSPGGYGDVEGSQDWQLRRNQWAAGSEFWINASRLFWLLSRSVVVVVVVSPSKTSAVLQEGQLR